jgi:ABC-2 type transport system permease protein
MNGNGMNGLPQRIAAASQFRAVAWLRWRLFANGFRRKGGGGELAARIIVFPVAALFVIGPIAGATLGAYAAVRDGRADLLTAIFWGIFVLQIVVSINISPPGLSFDPESLIRFPLSFGRYLTIRLFLGLLAASTIVGTGALLGAATGATVANQALGPVVYAAALTLALGNMLFVRMVFAWVDRWLSTRRARELFTVLIFVFSIGIQYVNVTVNNVGHHYSAAQQRARLAAIGRTYQRVEPMLRLLPPGLAGEAALEASHGEGMAAVLPIAGIGLYAGLFLAVFGWRMRREYRGENLSEAANSPAARPAEPAAAVIPKPAAARQELARESAGSFLSPVVAACLEKEWIYVRRNPAQFYGLIAPLAMVFLFASRMGNFAKTGLIFPAAVAYSVLGIAALAYNILGLDASGVQFYFMAPIEIRSVILAKNLFGFTITAVQLVLVYLVLMFSVGTPPALIAISTVCWVVFACMVNATIGNMRSITAPKKVDPAKISRKQASQLSALLCIGIMLAVAGLGAGLLALGEFARLPWLPIPILMALALGAFALYMAGLNRIDSMALNHRETLIEELSKAS